MKYFIILLISLASCTANPNPKHKSNDKQKIRDVIIKQQTAWNAGSLDSFMLGYWNNDSMRFISARGVTFGYNKVLANYKKGYPNKERMGTLSFDIKSIKMLDKERKIGQSTGIYYLERQKATENQKDSGYFSLIFKKFDNDQWKIIIDHTF